MKAKKSLIFTSILTDSKNHAKNDFNLFLTKNDETSATYINTSENDERFYVIFYQSFCNGIHNLKQNLVSQGSGFAGGNGSDGRQSEHGTFVFTDTAADAFL